MRHAPSRQQVKKLETCIIAPMQILDNDQQRLLRHPIAKNLQQHGKKSAFVLIRIQSWQRSGHRRQRDQFRQQSRQFTRDGYPLGIVFVPMVIADMRAQEIQKRGIRVGRIRLETISLYDAKSLLNGSRFCLSHQARFPNAGFTGEEDSLSGCSVGLSKNLAKRIEVGCTTSQYRANNGFNHQTCPSFCLP